MPKSWRALLGLPCKTRLAAAASARSHNGFCLESALQVPFNGDELILALVSLIRATNPAMLRQGPDGFTVGFESLENKQSLSADDVLLLKLRAALEGGAEATAYDLELAAAEGSRLAESLQRLESLQQWSPDVLEMSRKLRARLATVK